MTLLISFPGTRIVIGVVYVVCAMLKSKTPHSLHTFEQVSPFQKVEHVLHAVLSFESGNVKRKKVLQWRFKHFEITLTRKQMPMRLRVKKKIALCRWIQKQHFHLKNDFIFWKTSVTDIAFHMEQKTHNHKLNEDTINEEQLIKCFRESMKKVMNLVLTRIGCHAPRPFVSLQEP